jgi:hypothetical protein
MSRKNFAWLLLSIGAALVWLSPIGNFIGLLLYVGVFQNLFPATIWWDAKNADSKCYGAIADPRGWPASPAAACQAMHMCANEASLSERQHTALYEQISKMPGCQEP